MSSESDKYETFLRRIKVRVKRPATDHDKAKMAQGQTALLDKVDELDALLKRVKNAIRSRKDILDTNERELRSWIKSKTKEVLVDCEVIIDARQGGVLLVRTLDEQREVVKGPRPLSAKEREVFNSTKSQTGFFDDPVGVNEELAKKLSLTDYISEQAPVDVDEIIANALDEADLPEDVKNVILSLDMDEDEEKATKKKDKAEKKEKGKKGKKNKGSEPTPPPVTPPAPTTPAPTPEPGPAKAEWDEDAPKPPKAAPPAQPADDAPEGEIIMPQMEGAEEDADAPTDAPEANEETADSDAQPDAAESEDEGSGDPADDSEDEGDPEPNEDAADQHDATVDDDIADATASEEPEEEPADFDEDPEDEEEDDTPPEVAGEMSPEWQGVANAAGDTPAPSEVTYDVDESDLPPDSMPDVPPTTEPETTESEPEETPAPPAPAPAPEPQPEPVQTPPVADVEPSPPAATPATPEAPAKRKPGRPPKPKDATPTTPPVAAPPSPPAPVTPPPAAPPATPPPAPATAPAQGERTLANNFGMPEKLAKNALMVLPNLAGGGTPPLQGEVIFLSTMVKQVEKATNGVRLTPTLIKGFPSVFVHLAQEGVLLSRTLPDGDVAYWHPNIAADADKQIAAFLKKK